MYLEKDTKVFLEETNRDRLYMEKAQLVKAVLFADQVLS